VRVDVRLLPTTRILAAAARPPQQMPAGIPEIRRQFGFPKDKKNYPKPDTVLRDSILLLNF